MTTRNEGVDGGTPRTFPASCRRTVTGAVLAGVLATASLAAAAPARADEVLTFRNRATGRCLDSNWNGDVYTLPCNGGNFQKWRIADAGRAPAYGQQFVLIDEATGRCLRDVSTDGGPYTGLRTEECANRAHDYWESWEYVDGNTHWRLYGRSMLDSNAEGKVYLHAPNGGTFQTWDH